MEIQPLIKDSIFPPFVLYVLVFNVLMNICSETLRRKIIDVGFHKRRNMKQSLVNFALRSGGRGAVEKKSMNFKSGRAIEVFPQPKREEGPLSVCCVCECVCAGERRRGQVHPNILKPSQDF